MADFVDVGPADRPRPTVDVHDCDGVSVGQGADVGDAGDDEDRRRDERVAVECIGGGDGESAVGSGTGRLDGGADLGVTQIEGERRPREDDVGQGDDGDGEHGGGRGGRCHVHRVGTSVLSHHHS